jgi:L-threonylcarbamoyladenylate synthase
VHLVPLAHLDDVIEQARRAGTGVAVLAPAPLARPEGVAWIDAPPEPAAYAHDLYANLRALDQVGAASIVITQPPDTPDWHAVRDRLSRAAARRGDRRT